MISARKWFHPNISGHDAERLLLDKGFDGSFLARPSHGSPGNFTLSVRRGAEVTHIKIQNQGEFYDLFGGSQFASLTELVQHYAEGAGTLKEKSGEVIFLRYPFNIADPTPERWFHGSLPGKIAENMLKEKGKNGTFLVRESQTHPGNYVLSLKLDDKIHHIIIHCSEGQFDIGGGENYDSLADLIEHYKNNAMVDVNGTVLQLKQPLYTSKFLVANIEDRVKKLQEEQNLNPAKGGFWDEFEGLQHQECKGESKKDQRKEGSLDVNKSKNRYKNILPYDHTRVILTDTDKPGFDYVNANFIEAKSDESAAIPFRKRYIATQGCLPATITDFWRMVWQENCRVIVMTSKEVERGKIKCVKYWPDEGKIQQVPHPAGGALITIINNREAVNNDYILRELEVTRESEEKRRIFHFQFKSWPDHGVPKDPGCVLDFLHEVNSKQQLKTLRNSGPIVVHCSAGIGRTGTFIVIDIILAQLNTYGLECDIDIQKAVLNVRSQRSGMVQTEAQYKFVYIAIQHYIDTVSKRRQAQRTNIREYTNLKYSGEGQASGSEILSASTPHLPTKSTSTKQTFKSQHSLNNFSEPIPVPRRKAKTYQT